MSKENFKYLVQIQINGSDSWYCGEGNTLAEAKHTALYACGDVSIKTLLVWEFSDEKSNI